MTVELFANLVRADHDPETWASAREAEGYDGVAVSDHFWLAKPSPHVWVALAAMAVATTRVTLLSAFANNLFRSPVEFAQASLGMQQVSRGRFHAGLGAGWMADEMHRSGRPFPDGPTRARQYLEALQVARALLETGRCRFEGEHYDIDVENLGPVSETPAQLVGSAGGPWLLRRVPPLVDRFDLMADAGATRKGRNDSSELAEVRERDVLRMVDSIRNVAPDVPIGLHVIVGTGSHPFVQQRQRELEGSFAGRFYGEPEAVGEALLGLEELGFNRLILSPDLPDTFERLAPVLDAGRSRPPRAEERT